MKRERGEKTGGSVPYGFDVDEKGRLIPNPREQEGLSLLRELRAVGQSFRGIGAELTARGFKTKSGKPWLPMTIQRLCQEVSA